MRQKEAMPIDRRIAVEIFGRQVQALEIANDGSFTLCYLHENGDEWVRVPRYSDDMAEAWQIVERLQDEGYDVMIEASGGMDRDTEVELVGGDGRVFFFARDASPAMAICQVALKWAEAKGESDG